MKKLLLSFLVFIAFMTTAQAEHSAAHRSLAGHLEVTLMQDLSSATIGDFLELEVHIQNTSGDNISGAAIAVDGGMMAHGHGLPTRPQAVELGEGRYLIRGLRFSMPGEWRLVLDVTSEDVQDRILIAFVL